MFVHRIKGLQEWYLYLEDDQVLTKDFSHDLFFNAGGLLKVHTSVFWPRLLTFGLRPSSLQIVYDSDHPSICFVQVCSVTMMDTSGTRLIH